MQLTLTVDETGKLQRVRSGEEVDQLFDSVMFLSDYADQLSLSEVAEKLEDVLDSILRLEGRFDNEVIKRLGARGRQRIESTQTASTAKRRKLVAALHSQQQRLAS